MCEFKRQISEALVAPKLARINPVSKTKKTPVVQYLQQTIHLRRDIVVSVNTIFFRIFIRSWLSVTFASWYRKVRIRRGPHLGAWNVVSHSTLIGSLHITAQSIWAVLTMALIKQSWTPAKKVWNERESVGHCVSVICHPFRYQSKVTVLNYSTAATVCRM